LDQQRYKYALWRPNPLLRYNVSIEEASTHLTERYFSWAGPATMAEFQWFAGLGVKTGKAALQPLGLAPIGDGSDRLLLEKDLDAFRKFKPPGNRNAPWSAAWTPSMRICDRIFRAMRFSIAGSGLEPGSLMSKPTQLQGIDCGSSPHGRICA
jgi:hypothetical protein